MGWETGVTLGADAVTAFTNTQSGLAQSKAISQSAEYTASNIANKTSRNIGTLETSFLKGGIALTGSGATEDVFKQAAAQGQTDIQRTIDNANANISNTVGADRAKSLSTIAGGFSKLAPGTISSALTQAWNGMTGNLDPSPQGGGSGLNSLLNGGTGTFGGGTDMTA